MRVRFNAFLFVRPHKPNVNVSRVRTGWVIVCVLYVRCRFVGVHTCLLSIFAVFLLCSRQQWRNALRDDKRTSSSASYHHIVRIQRRTADLTKVAVSHHRIVRTHTRAPMCAWPGSGLRPLVRYAMLVLSFCVWNTFGVRYTFGVHFKFAGEMCRSHVLGLFGFNGHALMCFDLLKMWISLDIRYFEEWRPIRFWCLKLSVLFESWIDKLPIISN